MKLFLALDLLFIILVLIGKGSSAESPKSVFSRPHSVSITEFGGVGDGVTLNTKAFQNAIFYLQSFADKGGAQLFLPHGRWLTGSFSLISHLTLSLDKNATIIGSTDSNDWPVIDPLPAYGRGRELPGRRHQSLIHGFNLTDVVITGGNGTIDGQGNVWWDRVRNKTLDYTRPHLVELMYSTGVIISNLTFKNSPFWTIHPVYSSQVLIQNLTILAPQDSPNTDGIDPDSSDNIYIEDCYIRTGDDAIAIKSGWSEYSISFGRPSRNITIRRIVAQASYSSGISFGSEISGGISEVIVEDIKIFNTKHGIRVKTIHGRGGYVRNIHISNVVMVDVGVAIQVQGDFADRPDEKYDPGEVPDISKITFNGVVGKNISHAGILLGVREVEFSGICLSNIVLDVSADPPWKCSYVHGYSDLVIPEPCELLKQGKPDSSVCYLEGNLMITQKPSNVANL